MFLLKSLKSSKLPISSLQTVFNALIIFSIRYALPSWGGFITAHGVSRLDSVLAKCFKFGYSVNRYTFLKLLSDSDSKFFKKICDPNHCLNHLLPARKPSVYNSRPKGHPYALPHINYELFKKSFIIRALFNFV